MTKLLYLHAKLALLGLCAISVESFFWGRPLRYPDITRARSFRELLDIANNEANRADEILQRQEENIKNNLIQISSNIQQRGDDLLNQMKTASPVCDKTEEITKLLNETTAELDKEAARDFVAEGRDCLRNIYNRFDANVKTIQGFSTRRPRRGQFINLRWSKVLLTTTRRNFELGVRRCLRTTADRTALQTRFQLSRYRTQFNICVARNPTTTSTTEITDTTPSTDTSTDTTLVTDSTTTQVTSSSTDSVATESTPVSTPEATPETTSETTPETTSETTPETTDEQTSSTEETIPTEQTEAPPN